MPCFEHQAFIFLPNVDSPRLAFLAQLVRNEGGTIVDEIGRLTKGVVVLINDSFIGGQQHLINEDIFLKEFTLDPNVLWGYIATNNLRCVKASMVSHWLKVSKFEILPQDLVHVEKQESQQSFAEGSETDTDVGDFNENLESHVREEEDIRGSNSTDEVKSVKQRNENKSDLEEDARYPGSTARQEKEMTEELIESQESLQNLEPLEGKNLSSFEGKQSKNQTLINFLEMLANRYKVKGDSFRSRGYNLAKIGIERYPFEIESGSQAQREVANVGPSIARKIQTILDTGTLSGVYESPEFEKNLDYLSRCHNVGTYTARRWCNMGLRTFSDVSNKLPRDLQNDWPILFGWSYYQDWSIPIPREECTAIWEVVRAELQRVDPKCQVEIQGSYVRGASTSGDVDMLFYKEGCDDITELATTMEELAIRLYHKKYVKCFLQLTPRICDVFLGDIHERFSKCHLKDTSITAASELMKKFYLGFKLSLPNRPNLGNGYALNPDDQFMSLSEPSGNPCRRVDFFCCKWSQIGASRLQWTGPKEFNRLLRMVAMEKGMKLTPHGLFREGNVLLESFDENKIFELLGEPYSSPLERNYLVKKRRCK